MFSFLAKSFLLFILIVLLPFFTSSMAVAESIPSPAKIIGNRFQYTIQPDDYLIKISARFGVPALILAQENSLDYHAIIKPGQRIWVNNPHIVPENQDNLQNGILINLPQRMLFLFSNGELLNAYPVGLGKPDWPTPEGTFQIISQKINKSWLVPKSIQEEMRREGKIVLEEVPPGPDNPLGKHWMGLSLPGYGIHGTIAPASVYHFQSHGCIRMHPDDVAALFDQVHIGLSGKIIYAPILLARLDDGRIFLEIHRDIYNKGHDPVQTVRELAMEKGISQDIDWDRAEEVINKQEGLAREINLNGTEKHNVYETPP